MKSSTETTILIQFLKNHCLNDLNDISGIHFVTQRRTSFPNAFVARVLKETEIILFKYSPGKRFNMISSVFVFTYFIFIYICWLQLLQYH